MNAVTRAYRSLAAGLKALAISWQDPSWRSVLFWGNRGEVDLASVDPRRSSLVMACVDWIGRTFPEAVPRVLSPGKGGVLEPVPSHPMLDLLEHPNPYYAGPLLWQATIADRVIAGNAYWYKARNGLRGVAELWWLPAHLVAPKRENGSAEFVTHYEYNPNGQVQRLKREDVVHFRAGLDPANPMLGLSQLACLLREIYTDEEAGRYAAAMLKNLGVPPVIISPEGDGTISAEDGKAIKADWISKTTGDRRGEPVVIPGSVKVQILGYSPQNMDLGALRNIPEERVSAVLGVPAAVVGFGTGVQQTKVGATARELKEMAYEDCLIPMQRSMGAELQTQLLPEFGPATGKRVRWDYSQVRALQEDESARWARYDLGWRGGWVTRQEARAAVNLTTGPEDDVYLMPLAFELVGPGAPPPEPEPLPAAPAAPLALPPGAEEEEAAKGYKGIDDRARERIRRAHIKKIKARERKFTGAMSRYFAAQAKALLAKLGGGKVLHPSSPEGLLQHKALKMVADDLFDDEFDAEWLGLLQAVGRPLIQANFLASATEAAADYSLGVDFDLDNPRVSKWIGERMRVFSKINETTREDITRALKEGEAAGEGIPELRQRIEGYYDDHAKTRAERTARTEVISASNQGAIESYRQAGVEQWEWLTAQDERVEEECLALEGKRFPVSVPFEMPHPQCRCVSLPVVE